MTTTSPGWIARDVVVTRCANLASCSADRAPAGDAGAAGSAAGMAVGVLSGILPVSLVAMGLGLQAETSRQALAASANGETRMGSSWKETEAGETNPRRTS